MSEELREARAETKIIIRYDKKLNAPGKKRGGDSTSSVQTVSSIFTTQV